MTARGITTRFIAAGVALALLASACGASGDETPGADREGPRTDDSSEFVGTGLFGGPFSDRTVDEAIDQLAESGIAVIPDEGGAPIAEPAEPASPMRLLRWQARNMTLEAASGGGVLGADLDALVEPDPEAPGAPPASQVLAAYVNGVDTSGAELARELVGDADLTQPDQVVFPTMVLTLFASDLAQATNGLAGAQPDAAEPIESGAASESGLGELQLVSSGGPICPDFAGFINEVIADVVKVLKLPNITVPDTGIPILTQILQAGADLFVGFVNFAIDAAASFVIDGVGGVLLKPVFSMVTTIAAIFAVTSQIVNALRPWTAQVTPAESSAHRGVGAPATNEMTLRVSVPGLDEWPRTITSCAKSLNLELPPLRPQGGHVSWDTIDPRGLTTVASKDETLDDTSTARLVLDLGQETREQHDKGGDHSDQVRVNVSLRRQEVENFKQTVRGLVHQLFTGVPQVIRTHLNYYSDQAVDFVLDSLADEIINMKPFTFVTVTYHGPPRPDEIDGDPSHGAEAAGTLPTGCPANGTVGHGTLQSLGNYGAHPGDIPEGILLCPYSSLTADIGHLRLILYASRVVESEVPGQLMLTSENLQGSFPALGWGPIEVAGASASWTGEDSSGNTYVAVTDGELTLTVDGPFDRGKLIATAERVLAAG